MSVDPAASELVQRLTGEPAEDLLALEGFPDGSDAVVYLSGSLVSGHANPWSDIDVFAVTDRDPVGIPMREVPTNLVVPHFIHGRRADYEYWRPGFVQGMSRRLKDHEFGTGRTIPGTTFLHIEEVFIHRLRVGVPLVNHEGFLRLQSWFDFERFAAYQTEEAIRHLDSQLEDLVGMRKGEDRDVALWVARQTLDVVVGVYLHHLGITDPVAKWQVKYLEVLDGGDARGRRLREDYWRLQCPEGVRDGGSAWHAHVEDVIALANRVTTWVQG